MLSIVQQTASDLIGLTPQDNIGTLKRTLGGIDELSYTIFPQSEAWGAATERLTTVAAIDKQLDEEVFRGRVRSISGKSGGSTSQTVTCESAAARLKDGIFNGRVQRTEILRSALSRILNAHNELADDAGKVYLGTCAETIVELTKAFDYVPTLDAVNEVVGDAGLEWRIRYDDSNDRYLLDVSELFGGVAADPVVIGGNLGSIRYATDPSAVGTRIIPLGGIGYNGERLTIRTYAGRNSIYIDRPELIAEHGVVVRRVLHDDIACDDPRWFSQKVDELYTAGTADVKAQSRKAVTWEITALDLSRAGYDADTFRVGWYYHIMHPILGADVTLRLIEMTVDYRNPQRSRLVFGDKAATLTSSISRATSSAAARQTAQAINITQMISTATGGISIQKLPEWQYKALGSKVDTTLYLATTSADFMAYLGDLPIRLGDDDNMGDFTTLELVQNIGKSFTTPDRYFYQKKGSETAGTYFGAVKDNSNSELGIYTSEFAERYTIIRSNPAVMNLTIWRGVNVWYATDKNVSYSSFHTGENDYTLYNEKAFSNYHPFYEGHRYLTVGEEITNFRTVDVPVKDAFNFGVDNSYNLFVAKMTNGDRYFKIPNSQTAYFRASGDKYDLIIPSGARMIDTALSSFIGRAYIAKQTFTWVTSYSSVTGYDPAKIETSIPLSTFDIKDESGNIIRPKNADITEFF